MRNPAAVFATFALTLIAAAPSASQAPPPRAPNVLLIIADDLGYGDLSAYGGSVPTPHIDALAASGVRFTNGYVTHPVCAPSRAAIMTGRYQQRFGYEFNISARDGVDGLTPGELTIGDLMKRAGYATGFVGKWHRGYDPGFHPNDRGFDEFYGFTGGATTFITHPRPGDEFAITPSQVEIFNYSPGLKPLLLEHPTAADLAIAREYMPTRRNRERVAINGYITEEFTREAVDFIDRNKARPFLLVLSHGAVHVPLQATRTYVDRFRHIRDKPRRVYAAMTSAMDDSVGAVMAKLRAEGLERNTLVVFVSDNGCAMYVDGICSNGGLSGFKETHFEGGLRVPYVVAWPGRIPAGQVDGRMASSLDILPTALAAAGVRPPTDRIYDGVDLLPLLTRDRATVPNPVLFWRAGPTVAVRDGRWKLILANQVDAARVAAYKDRPYFSTEPWARPQGAQRAFLYDLVADPGERHDLSLRRPEIVRRLQAKAQAWAADKKPPPVLQGRVLHYRHGDRWLELYE